MRDFLFNVQWQLVPRACVCVRACVWGLEVETENASACLM